MKNNNDHWQEMLDIARTEYDKQHKELSEQHLNELRTSVYAHIDEQFPLTNSNTNSTYTELQPTTNVFFRLFQSVRNFITVDNRVPTFAGFAFALFAIGFLVHNTTKHNTYFSIPATVASADLTTHVTPIYSGKGIISSTSERNIAFLTGITNADIDIGASENPTVKNNLLTIMEYVSETPVETSSDQMVNSFNLLVARQNTDIDFKLWFTEGYYVELIYLSAKHALITLDPTALQASISLFNELTDHRQAILQVEELNSNYQSRRNRLTNIKELSTPTHYQSVLDLTEALKVLAR